MLKTIVCPHCWHEFAPADILWIAAHGDLRGDLVLGGNITNVIFHRVSTFIARP